MKQGYFAVPKHLFTVVDRFNLCHRDIGILVEALYEYFVIHKSIEEITDGMSASTEAIFICLVCAEEEDYESF